MSDIFRQSTSKVKPSTKLHQTTSTQRTTSTFFTKTKNINTETQKANNIFSPKITESINTSSKLVTSNIISTTQANVAKESIVGLNSERSPISVTKHHVNNIVSATRARSTSKFTSTYLPESEYSPTKVSLFTLTALLGVIYGLAFILAVVWIVWLYVKRKSRLSLKRSQVDSREFCSINSVS
jgi:hypothetical protein